MRQAEWPERRMSHSRTVQSFDPCVKSSGGLGVQLKGRVWAEVRVRVSVGHDPLKPVLAVQSFTFCCLLTEG